MSVEKRITKRTMKEDKLVSATFKVTEYIQKNQNPFIIGVVVVVVLASAIMFFNWNSKRNKGQATALLTQAEISAASGSMEQYIADLQNISDKYSGTTPGKLATLRLANSFFSQKKYMDAEKYFDRILDKYADDDMMVASGSAGKAACLEIRNDFTSAAKYYKTAAEKNPGEIWTSTYLLKAGQNFAKANDKKSAQTCFEEIEQKYSTSTEASIAKRSLAELKY